MTNLIFASATWLAQAIRNRQVSSREVIEAHLARIDQVNPQLNAVVQLDAERALARAYAADQSLTHGEVWGPLHGVPFTVKDWIEAEGVICAAGESERAQFVPLQDATVVTRLRRAGGILLGKTNVLLDNPVYGPVSNPYNLEHAAGYSSSGEAAIIAAGGSPLGLGSDSGGSIRLPAHSCGVAGLKPTTGRVPNTGHYPSISAMNDPRTQIGPLARRIEDLALALSIIQGVDWRDASVVPVPLGDWHAVDLSALKAAFYLQEGATIPTEETVQVTMQAVQVLVDAGIQACEDMPPRIEETRAITQSYWDRPESISPDSWVPDGEFKLSGEAVERSLFEWDRYRRAMLAWMAQYDVIVTPASEHPAPRKGAGYWGISYTLPYSLTGYPCVVVRAGTSCADTSAKGLPIGVQVIARPWHDDIALAVAQKIEQALGGWQPPSI